MIPAENAIWTHSKALPALAIVAFFALVAAAGVRVYFNHAVPGRFDPSENGMLDFHNAVYFPALAYRQGANPYDHEYATEYPVDNRWPLYSPAALAFYLPLTWMPIDLADAIWFGFSALSYVALAAASLAVCKRRVTVTAACGLATLLLLSRPGHINLVLGQVTIPMVLGTIGALHFASRRPHFAAVCLAVTTVKPTYAVPLAFLLWMRRDRRAAIEGVALGGIAAALAALPIVGKIGWKAFVVSLGASHDTHVATMPPSLTRLDLMATAERIFEAPTSPAMIIFAAILCLLPAGVALARIRGRTDETDANVFGAADITGVLACLAILACVFHNMYDSLLLTAPWLSLAAGPLARELPRQQRRWLLALVTIPAVNYLSTNIVMGMLQLEGTIWALVASINGLAVATGLVAAIVMAWRFDRAASSVAAPNDSATEQRKAYSAVN